MKTLYISDLDGTLLWPNAQLSDKTISMLNGLIEQGMLFSVATARSIASVKTILADVKAVLPVILMNGVCIYDPCKNDYIKVEFLSKDSKAMLMKLIKDYQLNGFAYIIKDGVMSTYYENLNTNALYDFYKERVDKYKKQFCQINSFSSLSEEPLIYFTLIDYKEHLEPVYHILENIPDLNSAFYKDNYSPDLWYLEIYSSSASKYLAVRYLREILKPDQVICFGDNRNDLPLFEASDYRIAVGNAVIELKEKADLIIGNNTEDGVAAWLSNNYISH